MTRKVQLWVAILFTVCLQHLAAYPYPTRYNTPRESKDNWRYPYHYNTQLGQTSIQRSFAGASSNSEQPASEGWGQRYKDYASDAVYYNAYDRKTLQAVETDRIHGYIKEANAMKLTKGKSKAPETCLPSGVESMTTLTLNNNILDNLVDTINGEPPTTDTIILSRDGSTVAKDAQSYNAILNFYDSSFSSGKPNEIWMNKSPCPQCIHTIMSNYDRDTAVTIHIASVDHHDLNELIDTFKCLTVLSQNNFQILQWEWEVFRNILNEKCQNHINSTINSAMFKDKQKEFDSVFDFLHDIRNISNTTTKEWCPDSDQLLVNKHRANKLM